MKVSATKDGTNAITIDLDGNTGVVGAGGNGVIGSLKLVDKDNVARLVVVASPEVLEEFGVNVIVEGDSGQLRLAGSSPSIVMFPSAGFPNQSTIEMSGKLANIRVGGPGVAGDIALYPANSTKADINDFSKGTIFLDGQRGNISVKGDITCDGPGADCAEDFDLSGIDSVVDPGTVMVIEEENRIRPSSKPYDTRVAGVISGAGGCKPAILLDKKRSENNRLPVALLGKTFCKVDAGYGPIEVGDLLTTSSTPGYAMRASAPDRSFGAVIGKALRPLKSGQDLIPILIALQ